MVKVDEAYTNNGLPYAGTTVTDHLTITTNFEVSKFRMVAIAPDGTIAWSGSTEIVSGNLRSGKWKVVFEIPKFLAPGKYLKKYFVSSSDNQELIAMDWTLEVQRPKYWIEKTCDSSKGDCQKESPLTLFSPIETCKIKDATVDRSYGTLVNFSRNGFPRPAQANFKPTVLVVPVEYTDLPFNSALPSQLEVEYKNALKFYGENSYGKLEISFVTLPREKWISIPYKWQEWKDRFNGDLASITKATIDLTNTIDLTKYQTVFFATSKSSSLYWGGGSADIYQTPFGSLSNVYFTVGGNTLSFEHNLGHTLYQLEDLYIHPWDTEALKARSETVIRYDIMANGSSPDYIGWNRWLNGWLNDQDIHCLPTNFSSATIKLNYLTNSVGKRLAVIPGTNGIGLFAEYREALANEGKGVLIYRLNSNIPHGSGPIQSPPRLLTDGLSIEYGGFRFNILGSDGTSVYLQITQGSSG